MGLDDFLHDGKAKPGSFLVLPAGGVGLIKAFPDFFQAVLGDPDSGILHRDEYFPAAFGGLDGDGGVRVAEFDRIVNEVIEHLLDLAHVGGDVQLLIGQDQLEGDLLFEAGSLEGLDGHLDSVVDVEVGDVQHGTVRVEFVQFQHALGQLVQTVCFHEDDIQVFVL